MQSVVVDSKLRSRYLLNHQYQCGFAVLEYKFFHRISEKHLGDSVYLIYAASSMSLVAHAQSFIAQTRTLKVPILQARKALNLANVSNFFKLN
jgi:hypothetical protein